ncbi:MAG: LamG domain-containing protein [Betaproteobacteria bacterium]|nr:LamG domain-containing protein [Betaproteobacteria bacterium]
MNRRILKSILATLLVVAACSKLADVTGPRASSASRGVAPRLATLVGRSSLVASLDNRATPAGLISCWGGEGSAVDSVASRLGQITGNVTFVPGRIGSGFSFNDHTADIVTASDAVLDVGSGSGMTMAAWVNTRGDWFSSLPNDPAKGSGPILEFWNGAHLWSHHQWMDPRMAEFANLIDVNGTWHIVMQQNVVPLQTWTYVAVTYDRATGYEKIWSNGFVEDSAYVGDISPLTSGPVHIGSRITSPNLGPDKYAFNGIIDEPAIFNRALTKDELVALTASTSSICHPKPIALRAVSVPTAVESGVPFTATFDLITAAGMRARSYNNVTAQLYSGSGALLGTTTVSADSGRATFTNLILAGASTGTTLVFSSTEVVDIVTIPITVTQVVRHMNLLTAPGLTSLGATLAPQPSVELLDAAGLRMANSGNVVTASIVDGPAGGTLTGTLSATSVNGVATFTNLGVATSLGSYTIALSSGAVTAGIFVVSTGTQLLVDVPPTSVVNGGTLSTFAVRVADATGATASSSTAPVTVSATNGTVTGTTTVNAVNGVATFAGLRITSSTQATPVTLTVSAQQFPAVPLSIAITQTAATVSFVTQPTSASLNVALNPQPSIRVLDNAGQPMTSGTITASVASSPTSLSGTTTVPVVNGVATFTDLSLTSVGVFTISFNAGGTTTPLTLLLTTTGGGLNTTATQVAITSAPTTVESGAAMSTPFRVEIRDVNGVLVSNAAVTVSATIASGSSGVLQGTTSATSVNGVATFTNLRVGSTAGTVRLQFASSGLSAATSSAVTVTQVVRQLALVTQPGTPRLASTLTVQPVVELRDAAGLAVASGTGSVTASIGSGTAGTLTGTNPVTATAGRATFTNLALNGTGSYTLVFSMSGASSVTSSAISFAGTASLVFNGFLSPIDMGRVNVIEAGRVLPLRYSVTGVTAGTPVIRSFTSVQEACAVPTLLDHPWNGAGKVWDDRVRGAFTDDDDDVPEGYGQYDARRGYYHVNFATQRSWAGTCRLFTATLIDGTTRTVHFRFKRGASNTDSNDMTAWWGADATRRFKPILDAWKRAWKDSD